MITHVIILYDLAVLVRLDLLKLLRQSIKPSSPILELMNSNLYTCTLCISFVVITYVLQLSSFGTLG